MGRMRIISVEGLIGFKLQGFVNDATRTRDLDDASAVLVREAGVPFQPPLGNASGVDPLHGLVTYGPHRAKHLHNLHQAQPLSEGNHWRL
jgi:hypothetical protein